MRRQTHPLLVQAGTGPRDLGTSFSTHILGYETRFGGVQLADVTDELELLAVHIAELEMQGQATVLERA
jgi:hypothetical protein